MVSSPGLCPLSSLLSEGKYRDWTPRRARGSVNSRSTSERRSLNCRICSCFTGSAAAMSACRSAPWRSASFASFGGGFLG